MITPGGQAPARALLIPLNLIRQCPSHVVEPTAGVIIIPSTHCILVHQSPSISHIPTPLSLSRAQLLNISIVA